MSRLATKVVALLAVAGIASAANYGEACAKDTDCTEGRAPYCSIYFTDYTYERNTVSATDVSKPDQGTRMAKGVCVECMSDCDCGVNQFCGIDKDKVIVPWQTVQSANTGNGITNAMKKQIQLDAQSFTGMKIRSVCRGYDVPTDRCKAYANGDEDAYSQQVKEFSLTLGLDISVTKVPPMAPRPWSPDASQWNAWPQAAEKRFCGRINTFAPQFHTFTNLGDPAALASFGAKAGTSTLASTGNFYQTSAQCRTLTISSAPSDTCPACLYNSVFISNNFGNPIYGPAVGSLCTGDATNPNLLEKKPATCNCNQRSDALCCSSGNFLGDYNLWSNPSYTDPTSPARRCGSFPRQGEGTSLYSSVLGTGSNGYRTCNDACQPSTNFIFSRSQCYNTDQSVVNTNTDSLKTFCSCVTSCEVCVAANGGCGPAPSGYVNGRNNNPPGVNAYDGMFGTCSGPCIKEWINPPATTPPPSPEYTCNAAPGTQVSTFTATCLPSCVDCLAAAHAKACDTGYVSGSGSNGCPTIRPTMLATGISSSSADISSGGGACRTDGAFSVSVPASHKISFQAPPVDWTGWCESGSCKICREGDSRCSSDRGIPQLCRRGKWVSISDDTGGILENDNRLSTLLSISVFAATCMLISLGVLVAMCIKQ